MILRNSFVRRGQNSLTKTAVPRPNGTANAIAVSVTGQRPLDQRQGTVRRLGSRGPPRDAREELLQVQAVDQEVESFPQHEREDGKYKDDGTDATEPNAQLNGALANAPRFQDSLSSAFRLGGRSLSYARRRMRVQAQPGPCRPSSARQALRGT
jgi:hypothetical protein